MRDCPSVEHLDTMEFHGVKTSVVTKCSGTADILPVPFAESRSAWLARCAGTRSVARGGGLHFLNLPICVTPVSIGERRPGVNTAWGALRIGHTSSQTRV